MTGDADPLVADPIVVRLRAAGCVFAEDEAALLREAAGDGSGAAASLERLVTRRVGGEPLEQVLSWAEFAGLRIAVEPTVFVPRRRTEFVLECALSAITERAGGRAALADARGGGAVSAGAAAAGVVVLDLCCGSGAVGAAILARVPGAEVWACDLDAAAVACARRNLPAERVRQGDLYDALPVELRGRIDVVAVNAPYVPTDAIATMPAEAREHEARLALDGGADGLDVHRRIAAAAGGWLAPGGRLVIETSAAQAPVTAALFAAAGLDPLIRHSEEFDATAVVCTAP